MRRLQVEHLARRDVRVARRLLVGLLLSLAMVAGMVSLAHADALSDRVIAEIKRQRPEAAVRVKNLSELVVKVAGTERQVFLDNVRRQCTLHLSECDESVRCFVRTLLSNLSSPDLDPSLLRVIYRNREYIEYIVAAERMSGGEERTKRRNDRGGSVLAPSDERLPVTRPWLADIVQVVVHDGLDIAYPIQGVHLRALGIDRDAAFSIALAQTDAEAARLAPVPLRVPGRVFAVGGAYYASSFFAASAWRDFATRERVSAAIGCIGAGELVAVALDPEPAQRDQMERLCAAITRNEPRPVSARLLRWNAADGWQAMPR